MKLRTLCVIVGILVVACVAAYFLRRPPPPAPPDARTGQAVLPADVAAKVGGLRLTDQGKTVTVKKQADGSWVVSDYHGFAADFSKLSRFINDLSEAKIQRLVTSRPDRIARLEFKDTVVTLLDAEGKDLWQVTLGKNAEGGGRYLRYGTEEKAYQATLSAWLDMEAKNWADTTLLNLKAEDIAAFELGFAEGSPVKVTRAKKEDPWTSAEQIPGKQLKADKITPSISSLVSLRFSDTSDSSDPNVAAAKAHSRTAKLTTFDGKTYTLVLGRKPEEKKPKAKPEPPAAGAMPSATPSAPAEDHAEHKHDEAAAPEAPKTDDSKPAEPEFETIPAGPVYVTIASSDANAPVNALMQKRAFQISEWTFTGLPAKRDELWEDKPATPPPAPAPSPAPGPEAAK